MNYCTRSLKTFQNDLILINTSEAGSLNVTLFKEDSNRKNFFLVVETKTSKTYFYQWVNGVETDLFISQYIEGFLETARRTLWEF